MCTDFGPDRLRFAGLIPERAQKSKNNIGFQPTIMTDTNGKAGLGYEIMDLGNDNCMYFRTAIRPSLRGSKTGLLVSLKSSYLMLFQTDLHSPKLL